MTGSQGFLWWYIRMHVIVDILGGGGDVCVHRFVVCVC